MGSRLRSKKPSHVSYESGPENVCVNLSPGRSCKAISRARRLRWTHRCCHLLSLLEAGSPAPVFPSPPPKILELIGKHMLAVKTHSLSAGLMLPLPALESPGTPKMPPVFLHKLNTFTGTSFISFYFRDVRHRKNREKNMSNDRCVT